MTNYTDYNFYVSKYKGDMPQDDFDKLVIRASAEVRKNIFNRTILGYEEEVQMATCSVADILKQIESLNKKDDNETVKSESVGDYSRTYTSITPAEKDVKISNLKSKISEEIRMYLLDTGLLYRGV